MRSTTRVRIALLLVAVLAAGCAESAAPPDEATLRAFQGREATPQELNEAASHHYAPAAEDYFEDMDRVAGDKPGDLRKLELNSEEIKGRNAWVLWTGGNEAFWDWLARHSYGSIDLLKLLDSNERGKRFAKAGFLTEPGTCPPSPEETEKAFGIRYDRPDPKTHVEHRKSKPPAPSIYGYPSGIVGLRLFPNPEFIGSAKANWKPDLYYSDTPTGRAYASRPDTIRPFRVGMSCGFCHIAPHPLSPPEDRESPEWKNLSNNIGNQYMRFRSVFTNTLGPDNYLYHVLDAQLPGTIDTSLVASDNINNANTINAFFGLSFRLERAKHNPPETTGADTLAYLQKYVDPEFQSPHEVPRVLLDGSDSVGIYLALARVYLNIGAYHQQWIRLHNPLLGFRPQKPFKAKDCEEKSVYWHATRLRVPPMAKFFLKSTNPQLLKDAPGDLAGKGLKGDGTPWHDAYKKGREVFARNCIACHSSIQPGDDPKVEKGIKGKDLPDSRTALRLRLEDLARLTRGDGSLPPAYLEWAKQAVEQKEAFWKSNYLSTDVRIPVTLTRTNSARAMATNALHDHMWEDFASLTYKELDSVGRIRYRDPFSGADKSFPAPSGGPGYYRVPTLISIWATAPFFHNNALGKFNNDPSVKGRLEAFDDAIGKLLWPQRRLEHKAKDLSDHYAIHEFLWPRGEDGHRKQRGELSDAEADKVAARISEQLQEDQGFIWRTSEESWFSFQGHDIPIFLAGVTGWSPFWVAVVPWLPSIAFVLLGTALLLSGPLVSFRERLEKRLPSAAGLFTLVRMLLALASLVLAVVAGYFVWFRLWPTIQLIDVATKNAVPWLRIQASLIPVLFALSVAMLLLLDRMAVTGFRRRVALGFGAACLLAAVLTALSFGRFLSGHGGGVTFGPVPAGVPVNVLANMDPDAPAEKRQAALDALTDFVLDHHRAAENSKPGRKEFEDRVAPALMNASKCPDFVLDRGHDYEVIRRMSDEDKTALIELLKTF